MSYQKLQCIIFLFLVNFLAQGYSHKIRLCVERQVDLNKCNDMIAAAKAHSVSADFECLLDDLDNCILKIANDLADAVVVDGHSYKAAKGQKLVPILYEGFGEDNVYVAIADSGMTLDEIKNAPVEYDEKNVRASHSAMLINHRRGSPVCGGLKAGTTNTIKIINSKNLKDYENKNMKLICSDLERKDLTDYKKCNVEANLVNAIFTKKSHEHNDDIVNGFKMIADNFGPNGQHKSQFQIFGFYQQPDFNGADVIFSDDVIDLLTEPELPNGITEEKFDEIHCHANTGNHH